MRAKVLLIAALLLTSLGREAGAGYAVSFSLPQSPVSSGLVNGVDGFDFTPTTNLVVDALGWFDAGGDGLLHSHPVGIYNTTTGVLLTSATVDNSSILDPTTDFRYTAIATLTLLAGTKYTLIGYGEGPNFDPYINNPNGGYSFGQGLTYQGFRTARASGLFLPTGTPDPTVTQALYVGANFRYSIMPNTVPEPASAVLLGLGCGMLVVLRRRVGLPRVRWGRPASREGEA